MLNVLKTTIIISFNVSKLLSLNSTENEINVNNNKKCHA